MSAGFDPEIDIQEFSDDSSDEDNKDDYYEDKLDCNSAVNDFSSSTTSDSGSDI